MKESWFANSKFLEDFNSACSYFLFVRIRRELWILLLTIINNIVLCAFAGALNINVMDLDTALEATI